jgi:hypothetical protein
MAKYYVVTTVYKRKKTVSGGTLACLILLALFIYGVSSGINYKTNFSMSILNFDFDS